MNIKKQHSFRAASDVIIRPFRKNDIEFVISRQLSLYASEYGFTSETWKTYLAGGVHTFVNQFDEKKDCMFILEKNGVSSGCAAITHVDEVTAQLRFFFLEPGVRGWGAGRKLLERTIDFAREKRYDHVFLWTFSTLMAAHHLYASKGFQITETHVNNDWGKSILEERWNLDL